MAVTITAVELRAALRLGDTPEETTEATRLLATATELVTNHAPDAPDAVANEAVVRLAGYLFDQPFSPSTERYANAFRNSGAASLLVRYRVRRARNVALERDPNAV